MKKILSALVLISFLSVLLMPMVASAQEAPKECCTLKRAITLDGVSCAANSAVGPSTTAAGECSATVCLATGAEAKWGMFCLMNTLYNITDWIFVILVALAGIFIIIGAFTLLIAAGNPEKITSGRNYILYAAIGLVVGFLAKAIPNLVKMISGT